MNFQVRSWLETPGKANILKLLSDRLAAMANVEGEMLRIVRKFNKCAGDPAGYLPSDYLTLQAGS